MPLILDGPTARAAAVDAARRAEAGSAAALRDRRVAFGTAVVTYLDARREADGLAADLEALVEHVAEVRARLLEGHAAASDLSASMRDAAYAVDRARRASVPADRLGEIRQQVEREHAFGSVLVASPSEIAAEAGLSPVTASAVALLGDGPAGRRIARLLLALGIQPGDVPSSTPPTSRGALW